MFNPLVDSFQDLTDEQVEKSIRDLSRKYFQTRNPQLQQQIASILEMYKEEIRSRIARKQSGFGANNPENINPDLDNLINIS